MPPSTVAAAVAAGLRRAVRTAPRRRHRPAHRSARGGQARRCRRRRSAHRRAAAPPARAAVRRVAQAVAAHVQRRRPSRRSTRLRRRGLQAASGARGEQSAPRQPRLIRCTRPHSSSNTCTRRWSDRRLGSAGTRAMSGGNWNSAGRPSRVRKRRPGGRLHVGAHRPPAGDDEAPFAEARHMRVVRRGRRGPRLRSSPPRSRSCAARSAARWSARRQSRRPPGADRRRR